MTGAAVVAASRKEEKYADINGRYVLEPSSVETSDAFNLSARPLLNNLGSSISHNSSEVRKTSFFYHFSSFQ